MASISGFVLPFFPPRWLTGPPPGWDSRPVKTVLFHDYRRAAAEYRGDSGLRIIAHHAGAVSFDFSDYSDGLVGGSLSPSEDQYWDDVARAQGTPIRIANAWSLLLHSAFITLEREDIGSIYIRPEDLFHSDPADPNENVGGIGSRSIIVGSGPPPFQTVPREVFDLACRALDAALSAKNGRNRVALLSILNRALADYKAYEMSSAVVEAWTVCEALVMERWAAYISSSSTTVSRDRRRTLLGRDYSASVVIEALSLAGLVEDEAYRSLTSARRARNDWIHSLRPPSVEIAQNALTCAALRLSEWAAVPLAVGTNLSLVGL